MRLKALEEMMCTATLWTENVPKGLVSSLVLSEHGGTISEIHWEFFRQGGRLRTTSSQSFLFFPLFSLLFSLLLSSPYSAMR